MYPIICFNQEILKDFVFNPYYSDSELFQKLV